MDKRYNHLAGEKTAQELWSRQKTYAYKPGSGQLYSIDTPPPTVSGSLHIGHIFSYTQTDIIARFKRLEGHPVFYPFGFDDNGLPTERFVEKKLGVYAPNMQRSEFIKLCLNETEEAEKDFQDLWQKMGLSVDWVKCYSTISPTARMIAQRSFIDLYKKGFIYKKMEPALYCTTCRTSVAQAELEDVEKDGIFSTIAFKDQDGGDLLIATTRPELLGSCVAMFFHPEDERYKSLLGKQATVPVFGYKVPIMADELVDPDKGTGLVMCCTFGDKNDIAWFKKHNLEYRQSVGLDGCWTKQAGPLEGLKVQAARKKITELLTDSGELREQKKIKHSVNVYERSKKEIEYVMLNQWFLRIMPYKKELIELGQSINWYPSFMKTRYQNWVQNIGWDWCLSRQRFYGIPFPAWHCTACEHVVLADPKQLPIEPQEQNYKGSCPACNADSMVPDTDVMDTWNTSSLTPYITASLLTGKPETVFEDSLKSNYLPMGMRPQAHDIIRTWAFYTIIKTWMHQDTIPWRDIVISGHVLSRANEKISKSRGNTPTKPSQLLVMYPADVIRYWTASGNLGTDIAFSDTQFKLGQRLLNKLWNAFRFIGEHMSSSKTTTDAHDSLTVSDIDSLNAINRWILTQSDRCFERYQRYLDRYEYNLALNEAEHFFWSDWCDNYLELVKHQLFNPELYPEKEVAATKTTLFIVGLRILQLFAPYMPHITEVIYQELYKAHVGHDSLHTLNFARVITPTFGSMQGAIDILAITAQVRKLKTEHKLSLKVPLATLTILSANKTLAVTVTSNQQLINGVTQANSVLVKTPMNGDQNNLTSVDDKWHATLIFKEPEEQDKKR